MSQKEQFQTLKHTLSLITALLLAPLAALAIAPTALKTEFLENPLGIDTANPRFLWIVEDPTPGAKQTAYQLQAASSAEKLAKGEADLWDSGKVASDETLGIEYGGPASPSRWFVWWRIKVGMETQRNRTGGNPRRFRWPAETAGLAGEVDRCATGQFGEAALRVALEAGGSGK